MAVVITPKQKGALAKNSPTRSSKPQKQYSFKNEHIATIFNFLIQHNMIKLPESKRSEKVEKTNNPNYSLYHQIIGHPTKNCFILKDKIYWCWSNLA